jgi:hypothetical protein
MLRRRAVEDSLQQAGIVLSRRMHLSNFSRSGYPLIPGMPLVL